MSDSARPETSGSAAATACALLMIAWHVAARAARDALFLTEFDVTRLPHIVLVTALLSVLVLPLVGRAMVVFTPARFTPLAFLVSAVAVVGIGLLRTTRPGWAAVALYLQVGVLGAVIVSAFWSVINEQFDPQSAKRVVGRIARAATIGGVLGGLLAERASVYLTPSAMFPILAGLHAACAGLLFWAGRGRGETARSGVVDADAPGPLRVFRDRPYLRTLAITVLLLTITSGLIDYLFKARATEAFEGAELLRFFAVFYAGASVLTFAVQAVVAGRMLRWLGVARAVVLQPVGILAAAAAGLLFPPLAAVVVLRGTEEVLRNSIFRSSYELLYIPVATAAKRRTKTLIDVGMGRLGDALAAVLVLALLWAGGIASSSILVAACAGALLAAWVGWRLERGYVHELEESLVARARDVDLLEGVEHPPTRELLRRTIGAQWLSRVEPNVTRSLFRSPLTAHPPAAAPTAKVGPRELTRIDRLGSREPDEVRAALASKLTPDIFDAVIPLLAWDEVAPDAVRALARAVPASTHALVAALTDPDEDFSIRRRVPVTLAPRGGQDAVDGLLGGLSDRRFEVRYRCGRALAAIGARDSSLVIEAEAVEDAVRTELVAGRAAWEGRRLIDQLDLGEESPDPWRTVLKTRTSRSLEHVFGLLSLVHPPDAVEVAFRGVQTRDAQLRGTSLEYLDRILPADIRRDLWPLIGAAAPEASTASPDEVLRKLLGSQESIRLDLQALRDRGS